MMNNVTDLTKSGASTSKTKVIRRAKKPQRVTPYPKADQSE